MTLNVHPTRVEGAAPGGLGPAPGVRYLPIAAHGLIGDLHSVALVGTDVTIDWYCCPRFDSPSIFAAKPLERSPADVHSHRPHRGSVNCAV